MIGPFATIHSICFALRPYTITFGHFRSEGTVTGGEFDWVVVGGWLFGQMIYIPSPLPVEFRCIPTGLLATMDVIGTRWWC